MDAIFLLLLIELCLSSSFFSLSPPSSLRLLLVVSGDASGGRGRSRDDVLDGSNLTSSLSSSRLTEGSSIPSSLPSPCNIFFTVIDPAAIPRLCRSRSSSTSLRFLSNSIFNWSNPSRRTLFSFSSIFFFSARSSTSSSSRAMALSFSSISYFISLTIMSFLSSSESRPAQASRTIAANPLSFSKSSPWKKLALCFSVSRSLSSLSTFASVISSSCRTSSTLYLKYSLSFSISCRASSFFFSSLSILAYSVSTSSFSFIKLSIRTDLRSAFRSAASARTVSASTSFLCLSTSSSKVTARLFISFASF
mmetsp:Transcript_45318/g.117268  ORF Transcript_45318/g.117268 Transcript_45318/m.117268 type:complete len:307 (-) Transcript_45318:1110-2030(-)